MFNVARLSLAAVLVLAILAPQSARAGTQSDPVDCWIDNLTPQTSVGAQASYIVNLSGGLGSYSVTLDYGDGGSDSQSVNGSQASFTHLFSAIGTYTQTAFVNGAGSNASCATSTSVS